MAHTLIAALRQRLPNGKRHLASLVLAAALVGSAACSGGSDKSTGPQNANPAGTYSLRQVDQASLPVTVYDGPFYDDEDDVYYDRLIIKIVGGAVTLDDDRFTIRFDLLVIADGQSSNGQIQVSGDYEISGEQVSFNADDDVDLGAGTLRNGALSIGIDFMDTGTENRYSFKK